MTLRGRRIGEELVNFARRWGITRIIAGSPTQQPRWQESSPAVRWMNWFDFAGTSMSLSSAKSSAESGAPALPVQPKRVRWSDYQGGLLYLVLATALCFLMFPYFDLANLIMVYLLAAVGHRVACGPGPGHPQIPC